MKLEAKDRLNPSMVAVATISNIRDGMLLIHFDGWTTKYDYWCKPTTPDIHPVGWCAKHGHHVHPPKGKQCLLIDKTVLISDELQEWNLSHSHGMPTFDTVIPRLYLRVPLLNHNNSNFYETFILFSTHARCCQLHFQTVTNIVEVD